MKMNFFKGFRGVGAQNTQSEAPRGSSSNVESPEPSTDSSNLEAAAHIHPHGHDGAHPNELNPAPVQPDTWKKTGERALLMTSLGAVGPHLFIKAGTTAWRALHTAPSSFIGASSGHAYASGAAHILGASILGVAAPWFNFAMAQRRVSGPVNAHMVVSEQAPSWLKKSLMGLVVLSAVRDFSAESGALVFGAGSLALVQRWRGDSRAHQMVTQHMPWMFMELGRVAVPMASNHIIRQRHISQLEAALHALPVDEDLTRPWTEMAFVGGHLAQDGGNVPFYPKNNALRLFAPLGRFASHQSLSLGEQMDRGYDAFALEMFRGANDSILSSHSDLWSYGLLEDALSQLAQGLDRNPEAVIVLKMSPQAGQWFLFTDLWQVVQKSGLDRYMPLGAGGMPGPDVTKSDLRANGVRAIWLDEFQESYYSALSVADLVPTSSKQKSFYSDQAEQGGVRILNLFTSWGYEPWSEYFNLYTPALLEAHGVFGAQRGAPINIVFANDLETSGLLAFKRKYNAPR